MMTLDESLIQNWRLSRARSSYELDLDSEQIGALTIRQTLIRQSNFVLHRRCEQKVVSLHHLGDASVILHIIPVSEKCIQNVAEIIANGHTVKINLRFLILQSLYLPHSKQLEKQLEPRC